VQARWFWTLDTVQNHEGCSHLLARRNLTTAARGEAGSTKYLYTILMLGNRVFTKLVILALCHSHAVQLAQAKVQYT
jgi:hypothetical protein